MTSAEVVRNFYRRQGVRSEQARILALIQSGDWAGRDLAEDIRKLTELITREQGESK